MKIKISQSFFFSLSNKNAVFINISKEHSEHLRKRTLILSNRLRSCNKITFIARIGVLARPFRRLLVKA